MNGVASQPPVNGSALADLVALARIPAPSFEEEARIAWLESRLADAPGRRSRDSAGNLVWRWGEGPPRLVVTAHVDTVFPSAVDHDARIEGDEVVGPGVGDNAAAVAVAISVVESLLGSDPLEPGALVFTVCEEGLGNLRGAAAACDELRPGSLIALEGHGLDAIHVDAVGSARVRLGVTGPGGHSWVDRGAPSATHALVGICAGLIAAGTAAAPVNIGQLSGGQSVNAIADGASALVEVRSVDQRLIDAFLREVHALSAEPPLELAVEELGRRPAGRLDRSAELLRIVRAVRAKLELPDHLVPASTDANAALARGIPALALGVATGSGMHTTTERISVPSLALGHRQLEQVIRAVLSDAGPEGTAS
jgi:acetylornithine deacetylase/succinyl-diaminopimelate desuccinylase-like protein